MPLCVSCGVWFRARLLGSNGDVLPDSSLGCPDDSVRRSPAQRMAFRSLTAASCTSARLLECQRCVAARMCRLAASCIPPSSSPPSHSRTQTPAAPLSPPPSPRPPPAYPHRHEREAAYPLYRELLSMWLRKAMLDQGVGTAPEEGFVVKSGWRWWWWWCTRKHMCVRVCACVTGRSAAGVCVVLACGAAAVMTVALPSWPQSVE